MTALPPSADVVVIGAGIVGCSTAFHLAEAGAGRVLLVERENAVGMGSTGACAGGFRHQFSTEVNVALSKASIPMITGFTREHDLPLDVSQDGYLFLVRDDAAWDGFVRAADLQRAMGVEVEVLTTDEAARLVPGLALDDVVGATFGPRDGIADPGALTQGYETLARRHGVVVALGTAVNALVTGPGGLTAVRTERGDVATRCVIVAAGAWSAPVAATAGIDLPIEPVPRVVVTTSGFPGAPGRRTLVIDVASSFYFHREADGVLMGMGGADVVSFDTSVDERFVVERLVPRGVQVFPPLAEAGLRSMWAGLYEMTPDRHPIVGPGPVDGVWLAAGFSGHGFQHGPVVGKLLAEMIVEGGARTLDARPLAYDRFVRGEMIREGLVV